MNREKDKFGDTFYWSNLDGTTKTMPKPCFQAQMAAISTGIFVFGGGANGILKQQKFYNFSNCEWENVEFDREIPPLAASAVATTPDDLIFGFGGATVSPNGPLVSGDLYKIDLKAHTFEIIKIDSYAPKARLGASLTYYDHGLILFGGLLSDDVLSNEIWRFDLKSYSWTKYNVESKVFARVSHTAIIYDFKLVVYGGLVREFGHNLPKSGILYPKDDIAVFDFHRKQWNFAFIPPGGAGRPTGKYHHSAVVYKDEMYIYGGIRCKNPKTMDIEFDDDFYTINLQNYQFRPAKNFQLPPPRAGHACLLYGTKMYVYGGLLDESGDRYSNELFSVDLTRTIAPLKMSMLSPFLIKMSWNSIPGLNFKVTHSNDIEKAWKSFYLGDENYCLLDLKDSRFRVNVFNSFSITGGCKGYFTSFIYGKLLISDTEKCITDPVIMEARAVKDGIEFFHTGAPQPLLCRASTAVKDKWMNTNWKKVLSYTSKHHYRFTYKDLDLDISQNFSRLQFKLGSNTLDWIDIKEFMQSSVAPTPKRDILVLVDHHSQGEEVEEEMETGTVKVTPAMASAIKIAPLSPINVHKLPASRGPRSVSPNSAKSTTKFPFLGGSIPSTSPRIPLASPVISHGSPGSAKNQRFSSNTGEANPSPKSQPAAAVHKTEPKRTPKISEGEIIDSPVEAESMMDVDAPGISEKPPIAPVKINRQMKPVEIKSENSNIDVKMETPVANQSPSVTPQVVASNPQQQSPKMEVAGLLSPKVAESVRSVISQDSPIRPAVSPLSPVKKPEPPKVVIDRNYIPKTAKSETVEPTGFTIQRAPSNNSAESLPDSATSEPSITPQAVYRPKHLRHYFSNVPSATTTVTSSIVDAKDDASAESVVSEPIVVKRKPGRPRKEPRDSENTKSPAVPKRRKLSLDGSQSDYDDQQSSPKMSASKPKTGKKKVGRPRKISQDDLDDSSDPLVYRKTSQWPVEGTFDIDHSVIGHQDSEFYYHLGFGEKFDVYVDGDWRTGRVHYYVPTTNKTWGLMYSVDGWDICYTTILDLSLPDIHEKIKPFDKDTKRGKSDTMASLREKFKGNLKKTEKLPKKGALFIRNEVFPE